MEEAGRLDMVNSAEAWEKWQAMQLTEAARVTPPPNQPSVNAMLFMRFHAVYELDADFPPAVPFTPPPVVLASLPFVAATWTLLHLSLPLPLLDRLTLLAPLMHC